MYQQLQIIPKIAPLVINAGKMMLLREKTLDFETKINLKDKVTKFDKAIQKYLISELKKLFPNASFVGEEGDQKSAVNPYKGEVFIIDPIDGTSNFIAGLNYSAVSVGYVKDGTVVAGSVYNPFTNEHFYAEKGLGSYLNGEKITVNEDDLPNGMVVFGTAVYYDDTIEKTKRCFCEVLSKCNDLRRMGAASLDICSVAAGRFCGFFECRLCPYDYCGAQIILQEAGGIISDFNGNPVSLSNYSSVVCGNKKCYDKLRQIINNA